MQICKQCQQYDGGCRTTRIYVSGDDTAHMSHQIARFFIRCAIWRQFIDGYGRSGICPLKLKQMACVFRGASVSSEHLPPALPPTVRVLWTRLPKQFLHKHTNLEARILDLLSSKIVLIWWIVNARKRSNCCTERPVKALGQGRTALASAFYFFVRNRMWKSETGSLQNCEMNFVYEFDMESCFKSSTPVLPPFPYGSTMCGFVCGKYKILDVLLKTNCRRPFVANRKSWKHNGADLIK